MKAVKSSWHLSSKSIIFVLFCCLISKAATSQSESIKAKAKVTNSRSIATKCVRNLHINSNEMKSLEAQIKFAQVTDCINTTILDPSDLSHSTILFFLSFFGFWEFVFVHKKICKHSVYYCIFYILHTHNTYLPGIVSSQQWVYEHMRKAQIQFE